MNRAELFQFISKHRIGVLATLSPKKELEAAVVSIAVTDQFEIVFETVATSRKCKNLRKSPKIVFVIGWDEEATVQYEGIASEPKGAEGERIKEVYFGRFPERREMREGLVFFKVSPLWLKHSDLHDPDKPVLEYTKEQLDRSRNWL